MNGYEQFFQNPLVMMGAHMMRGADPRGEGLGGIGTGILGVGQTMRQQAQLEEENARARRLADLEAQTFQAKLAQQGQPDISKTPTYIYNPTTKKMEILQLSATGPPTRTPLPEGYEPALPLTYQDVGPVIYGMQRGATQPAVVMQKGLTPEAMPETRAQQAEAVETAKSQTAARLELPDAEAKKNQVNKLIDDILNHPGLDAGTGKSAMLPIMPGSDRLAFETLRKQLAGGTFLQALNEMRQGGGVGQITELEGEKAQAAIARMEAAVKKEDFIDAMEDYRSVVNAAYERKKRQAGGQTQEETPQAVVDWSEL